MRVLIRFVRRGPGGGVEQRDKLYDGEAVTLGRATDQVVQIKDRRVALSSARIILRSGQPVLVSCVPDGVLVNGTIQREARLRVADTVNLGANVLRILAPEAGCDLAFSFELDARARSDELVPDLPRLRLAELGFAKRRWSWALFLVVLVLGLMIPAAGVRSPSVQDALRSGFLPDDHFWSPGPLSRAHEALGARCEACHEKPFQRVRNGACLTCHAPNLRQHADRQANDGTEGRCAACHGEHHEPATLVREDPVVCTDCHRNLTKISPETAVTARVTDFATDHPGFRLPARDASGLRFPHTTHVAPDGVRSPLGATVLGCTACHVLEPGGARFRPLRMDRDCAGCHLLDFDPAYPERTLPHGNPRAVAEFLVDYYSRRYLESYADPRAGTVTARRAGPKPSAAERERLLRGAREQASLVARDVFERRSCVQCHEVTRTGTGPDGAPDAWKVQAVEVRSAWLPASAFNHAAHSTALTRCETCHQATDSGSATDVLMPEIGTCRECHAGGDSHRTPDDRVTSTCALCHGFHNASKPLWQARTSDR